MNIERNCPLCGAPQYVENWCGDDREEPDRQRDLCPCEPLHSAIGRKRNVKSAVENE